MSMGNELSLFPKGCSLPTETGEGLLFTNHQEKGIFFYWLTCLNKVLFYFLHCQNVLST